MKVIDYDLIIVGAGPVGAAAALALARAGLNIALLDASEPPSFNAEEVDLRVYAISHASEYLLTRLGAWDRIVQTRCCSYSAMEVWDADGPGRIRFTGSDVDRANLGHIVEQSLLRDSLLTEIRRHELIHLETSAELVGFVAEDDNAEITLSGGRKIRANLVIAADGGSSRTRNLAGIRVEEQDYRQEAIVAHLRPQKSHGNVARQIFHPDGPLALLPLQDGRVSIVWSTSPSQARLLMQESSEKFSESVTQASENVLGPVHLESDRAAFPLKWLHAHNYVAPRLALVGDAAHIVHPLAGQGVNLGLLDVAALAEVVTDARQNGLDVDDFLVLRRYERWRHSENLIMQNVLSGFHNLFSNENLPVRWVRGLGMLTLGQIAPIKRHVIRYAMGLEGDIPRLSRPLSNR